MHLRPTQFLRRTYLPRRHFHQRRAPQKHLRLPLHEDGIVAHARGIGAAGGGRAKYHCTGGTPYFGAHSETAEGGPAGVEDAELLREGGARGLQEGYAGEIVFLGYG